jgi:hypothetical protein
LKVLSLFETQVLAAVAEGDLLWVVQKNPGTSQTQLFECLDGKK